MTTLEQFGINRLKKFVENAKEDGICHNGYDIDTDVQLLVVSVVEQYIEMYQQEESK